MSFEKEFLTQATDENRTIEETLGILWKIVSKLPKNEITKIKDKYVEQYYQGRVSKMSFGQNVAATKIELLKYKKSSQVAVMVQKILDDKRKVLLKNIEEMIEEASKARGGIWDPLQDIYKSVNEAYLALGTNTVDSVAESTPPVMEVDVHVYVELLM